MGLVGLLFFFWLVPVGLLASLLSYAELKKATPWLVRFIDKSPKLRAIVQNSMPSLALISFNGLLPFLLEGGRPMQICEINNLILTSIIPLALSYVEGHKARSLIEYSLLKK
jgi:hypothetical protein